MQAKNWNVSCISCGKSAVIVKNNINDLIFHCPFCGSAKINLQPVVQAAAKQEEL